MIDLTEKIIIINKIKTKCLVPPSMLEELPRR
jgi:hypothetical protein